jgi:multidrug resistance efflux pump
MKKKVIAGLSIAAAVVVVPTLTWAVRGSARTSEVAPGPVRETVVGAGVVNARSGIADVRARTDGRVLRVYVHEGDHVEAGQLLAEMDSAEMKAILARLSAERHATSVSATAVTRGARTQERALAEAELKAAEHALKLAEDRARRMEALHASGAESDQADFEVKSTVDIARAHVAQARARRDLTTAGGRAEDVAAARDRVTAADASLVEAQEHLDRTRIVAPIAGVILARHVDEGDTVSGSALGALTLFEVANAADTEVLVEIEEPDATRIKEGQDVAITMPGGRATLAHGHIVRVGARLQKRTVGADDARLRAENLVRPIWVEWKAGEGALLPIGKRVEGVVELAHREASARVPRSAVTVRDGQAMVDVAWGPLRSSRPVTLGATDAEFVEVSGVRPGTKVLLARD